MKSREDIHKKLNDLFTLNLIEKLQEPLLKKINCLNKGNFNNRFDVRVASKDVDLNSWWKHPIYVIAKPSSKNVVIGITIQPQRWPRNNEDYSNEFSECIDRNNAKINDLIKAHAINATLVKKEVKTDGKFVLSNSFNVIIDNANPSDEDYTRFIDFFASLCSIVVSLSDELPVKWNSSSEGLNNENQELPETSEITLPKAQFGLSKKFEFHYDYTLTTAANLNMEFAQTNDIISSSMVSINPAVGFEFGYIELAFLRAGVGNFQQITQIDNTNKVSFQPNIGLGFKYKGIQVDYALTDLGNQSAALYSNVFSVKVDLGIFRR